MRSEWQRLDPRLLVIGPARALRQFLVPAVIAIFGVSSSGGLDWWWSVPIALVPVAIGLLPWLTTRYRITETALERRSGWLNKKEVTAPLDRVRSVDLESSLLHRILGVTTVSIGTGVDETRIKLDAIAQGDAAQLRHQLLAEGRVTTPADPAEHVVPTPPDRPTPPGQEPEVLATIDWSWLRFAPFSLSRLVIVAGALGALSQFADDLPFLDGEHLSSAWEWVVSFAIPLVALALFVGALIAWVIISVTGYVVQWFGLRLTREHGTLHLTAGLLTTKSISVEEARVRGLVLDEPLLLRLVGGAELSTLSTGVANGVTEILPPAPVEVARRVGADVLPGAEPLDVPLRRHGPLARRRSYSGSLYLPALLVVAAVVATVVLDLPWWPAVVLAVAVVGLGVVLGESAYRHLGHARTTQHLVSGDGTTTRRRTVLDADGIIGWVVAQTWFQRRLGLATLVATTAAGAESVRIVDVPLERAIEVADAATPGVLSAWLPGLQDDPTS
ncbi:PH domain-containing protein [Nocardioides sp. LHG3406-4]|uniref:PH domain-containing protein n=1 Tax=Nocardioides sp. LHG3406-4 TaxID=2804575 RepID=UPI003CF6E749